MITKSENGSRNCDAKEIYEKDIQKMFYIFRMDLLQDVRKLFM